MKDINDICILVQARLGSTRVPGKMLRPFAGTTLVDILFEKLNIFDSRRITSCLQSSFFVGLSIFFIFLDKKLN